MSRTKTVYTNLQMNYFNLCRGCRVGDLHRSVKPEPSGFGGSNPPHGTNTYASVCQWLDERTLNPWILVRVQAGALIMSKVLLTVAVRRYRTQGETPWTTEIVSRRGLKGSGLKMRNQLNGRQLE